MAILASRKQIERRRMQLPEGRNFCRSAIVLKILKSHPCNFSGERLRQFTAMG